MPGTWPSVSSVMREIANLPLPGRNRRWPLYGCWSARAPAATTPPEAGVASVWLPVAGGEGVPAPSQADTQPRTSGLMRLEKRRALLDRRHALIEHRGVELPIVAH